MSGVTEVVLNHGAICRAGDRFDDDIERATP